MIIRADLTCRCTAAVGFAVITAKIAFFISGITRAWCSIEYTVTAGCLETLTACSFADITLFDLAGVAAAISGICITIVAGFPMLNDAIAAAARTLACSARGFAKITFFFTAAVVAPVAGDNIAIITIFTIGHDTITAGCGYAAFANRGANVTRFNLTG